MTTKKMTNKKNKADALNNETLNNIVTANARPFPLMGGTSEEPHAETLFSDRDSQLEIDSLTPYVDLARMSRERYDSSPSIQQGAKMAKDRSELAARMKRTMDALCGRYPGAAREDAWAEILKKFPACGYIFQGELTDD